MNKDKEIKITLNFNKIKENSVKNSVENVHNEENKELDDIVKIVNDHNTQLEKQRAPRIGKTKEEIKKENIDKIKKKKRKYLNIKRLISNIIIIAIIICGYVFIEYAPIIGIHLPAINKEDVSIDLVSNDSDIYKSYCEELLVYSNNVLATYNDKGKKTWEYSLDKSFTPNIYIYGNYMVVSNNANGIVYLFEKKNEILNMKVDGQVECVYVDSNGNMAIDYSTNNYKKIIGVYNSKGKNLYNTYLDYEAIIDIKMLNNAQKLIITQANSTASKIGCSISILSGNYNEKKLEQLIKFDNNYIFDIKYIDEDIIILLDDKIVKYNINSKKDSIIKEYDSSQILAISILDKFFVSLEKSLDNDNKYKILTNDFNNVNVSTIELDSAPKEIINSQYLNYCLYKNKLQIFNKWGIEVMSREMDAIPNNIVVFDKSKSVGLIYTNRIEIIKL